MCQLDTRFFRLRVPAKNHKFNDLVFAFDTLSWEFLFTSLDSIDLPAPFIRLLKACICTTTFMSCINKINSLCGIFLWKGKSLRSPYC
uniref:Uncharacterized protein n=1 Tax=Brassica oleracea TaxID=3712 RepID=A0A3P6GX03_BRAOL|nr:unnamed protein product [Brassica oleracea]